MGNPESDDMGSGSATAAAAQNAGPSLRRYADLRVPYVLSAEFSVCRLGWRFGKACFCINLCSWLGLVTLRRSEFISSLLLLLLSAHCWPL